MSMQLSASIITSRNNGASAQRNPAAIVPPTFVNP